MRLDDVTPEVLPHDRYITLSGDAISTVKSGSGIGAHRDCFRFKVQANFILLFTSMYRLHALKAKLWADRNAHRPQGALRLEENEYHGEVHAFFKHKFHQVILEMALVRVYRDFTVDDYGLSSCPGGLRANCLIAIEAGSIQNLVGTIYNSAMNRTYILDRTTIVEVPEDP